MLAMIRRIVFPIAVRPERGLSSPRAVSRTGPIVGIIQSLTGRSDYQRPIMSDLRDSIYFQQLARTARKLAAQHSDPVVKRRLRETAIEHDRKAKELAREEAKSVARKIRLRDRLRLR